MVGAGPSHDKLVQAMGFDNLDSFPHELDQLTDAVRDRRPLSHRDWARVLVATEIAFASDYYGSGWDFMPATGREDQDAILVLRAVQDKLIAIAKTVQL